MLQLVYCSCFRLSSWYWPCRHSHFGQSCVFQVETLTLYIWRTQVVDDIFWKWNYKLMVDICNWKKSFWIPIFSNCKTEVLTKCVNRVSFLITEITIDTLCIECRLSCKITHSLSNLIFCKRYYYYYKAFFFRKDW